MFISLLILRNLNNLRWQNQNWDWKSVTKLFQELDLPPYYPYNPSTVIGMKRFIKNNGIKKYRIATYPNKYPIMDDKTVETIELK